MVLGSRSKTVTRSVPSKPESKKEIPELFTLLISIAVAILIAILIHHYGEEGAFLFESISASLSGVLIFIVFQLWNRGIQIENFERSLESAERHARTSFNIIDRENLLLRKLINLQRMGEIVAHVGFHASESFIDQFKFINDNTLEFAAPESIVFSSYHIFWREVVALQAADAMVGRIIVARAIHSSPIDFWYSGPNRKIYTEQENLCEAGGRVFRILIEREADVTRRQVELYIEVMQFMESKGIKSVYMNVAGAANFDQSVLEQDFCIVSPNRYLAEWRNPTGEKIDGFRVSTSKDRYLGFKESWRHLLQIVKQQKYAGNGIEAGDVQQLEEFRKKFFAEIDATKKLFNG